MELGLKLIEILAWPIVALVAILVLGPGGVLLRFTESLGSSVSNFTKALPELKSTALTMRSDVETLVSKSREMSSGFSEEFLKIEERISSLSVRLTEIMSDVKAVVEDIDRSKVIEEQEQINKAVESAVADDPVALGQLPTPAVESRHLTVDEMYDLIRDVWQEVYDAIRSEIGERDFDGRQIGNMARKLTDGRRTRQLEVRDADLIQRLYSQFKRFVRMQSYKEEWLTEDVFNSFRRGAEEAKRALRSM